jgi:hypothetical protein
MLLEKYFGDNFIFAHPSTSSGQASAQGHKEGTVKNKIVTVFYKGTRPTNLKSAHLKFEINQQIISA